MRTCKSLLTTMAAIVVVLASVASMRAGNIPDDHRMYLTFTRPVTLPGVALARGTYLFEMVDPIGGYGVVRVLSRDRKILYLTAFTNPIERPANQPDNRPISFKEAAPGSPLPIAVWWMEDASGREFIYQANEG